MEHFARITKEATENRKMKTFFNNCLKSSVYYLCELFFWSSGTRVIERSKCIRHILALVCSGMHVGQMMVVSL